MSAKARFTKEWARKIAQEYVERYCICFMMPDGGHGTLEVNDHRIHIVYICAVLERDEVAKDDQLDTFIHELIHVFHDVWGLPQKESVVERKTKRFCRRHKAFARELFDGILADGKCTGQNGLTNPFDRSDSIGIVGTRIQEELRARYGRS